MAVYPINRVCPISGERAHRVLGFVSAAAVCRANETYRTDYARILGIDSEDQFPIVQSTVSGCVYAGWSPPTEFLTNVYENLIEHDRTITATMGYRSNMLHFSSQVYETLLNRYGNPQEQLMALDYGCGYGTLIDLLSCRDLNMVGFEPSRERRESASTKGNRIYCEREDVTEMGPFDFILCTEVLEHLIDPLDALLFMRDNSHAKTLLAVTVPNCKVGFVTKNIGKSDVPRVINPWEHLNYFSSSTLSDLLEKAGFRVLEDLGAASNLRARFSTRGWSRYRNVAGIVKRAITSVRRQTTLVICCVM